MTVGMLLIVFPLVALVSALINGWAIATLWGWFVAPLFGLPELSIPAAIGVYLVATVIVKPVPPAEESSDTSTSRAAKVTAHVFLSPLFAVLVGAFVRPWL